MYPFPTIVIEAMVDCDLLWGIRYWRAIILRNVYILGKLSHRQGTAKMNSAFFLSFFYIPVSEKKCYCYIHITLWMTCIYLCTVLMDDMGE